MITVYTVVTVLLNLMWVYLIEAEKTEPTHTALIVRFLETEITHGLLSGVLTGLAMALYASVDRWTIRKLPYFRLALLIVAAIVSVLYVGRRFHIANVSGSGLSLFDLIVMAANNPAMITEPTTALQIIGTTVKYLAIGFTSLYVAGSFWRETAEQSLKQGGPQVEQAVSQ